jgi:hypothetical protein
MGPISDETSILSRIPSVQTHSDDAFVDGGPMLPSRNWIPAFAGKAEEGDATLKHLNASEH